MIKTCLVVFSCTLLNQNNTISGVPALTILAKGDVADVIRHFNCRKNIIIRLRTRFQKPGAARALGRPRVTNASPERYVTLTPLRRWFKTAKRL